MIDADRIGHEVLRRPDVIDAVRRAWGDAVIGADGQVDRKAVAARVFRADGDRGELDRLNAITHPPLWGELRDRLRRALATTAPSLAVRAPDTLHLPAPGGASAVPTVCGEAGPGGTAPPARFPETVRSRGVRPGVVIDAALLLEAGLDRLCDVVVFVDAPEPLRQARVAAGRGWSADELRRRESTQLPLREKVERAAHVVDNSGSAEATAALVAGLHGRILGTPFPAVGCTTRPGT